VKLLLPLPNLFGKNLLELLLLSEANGSLLGSHQRPQLTLMMPIKIKTISLRDVILMAQMFAFKMTSLNFIIKKGSPRRTEPPSRLTQRSQLQFKSSSTPRVTMTWTKQSSHLPRPQREAEMAPGLAVLKTSSKLILKRTLSRQLKHGSQAESPTTMRPARPKTVHLRKKSNKSKHS